jgi:hypothetical protein
MLCQRSRIEFRYPQDAPQRDERRIRSIVHAKADQAKEWRLVTDLPGKIQNDWCPSCKTLRSSNSHYY